MLCCSQLLHFSQIPAKATLVDGKFKFKNVKQVEAIFSKYPKDRKQSAILPLLHLAQEENGGFLNRGALEEVAKLTETTLGRVHETASFYTMFKLSKPRGKHLVERCNGLSCFVSRSEQIKKAIENACNGTFKEGFSKDKLFELTEVECLGACASAPVMIVDGVYYQNLTPSKVEKIFAAIKKGEKPIELAANDQIPVRPIDKLK